MQRPSAGVVYRRPLLTSLITFAPLLSPLKLHIAKADTPQYDGIVGHNEGATYKSINEALTALPSGSTVLVQSGRYLERLVIQQPVTLVAEPGTQLVHETDAHYESCIECTCNNVHLTGFQIQHKSPSVANNYAVHLVDSNAILELCDITSSTGSGVGIEGGKPTIHRCTIHNCVSNGVMLFGDLDGGLDTSSNGSITECAITSNGAAGVVVRADAFPQVMGNTIQGNSSFGLVLDNCGGVYSNNIIKQNSKGALAYNLLSEEVDVDKLLAGNTVDGRIVNSRA